ncbi:PD-(D/E)XK motif protein [Amycolatopsis sp. H20-H5]|uniref:PD-(D/E)XK motif protein n=1 Tax=Amycolatopsis sp. H20-H5 TaxID=3046309 RepID=UPI002DB87937|nr:PD-(D/E)XK motif protein [Amycolatopsis sp. H20-H5]MEC3979841.1 PD-(D/E)XK motif protein [Amycolatopsis sp. H20-H5]
MIDAIDRHLDASTFERYVDMGVPLEFAVEGHPPVQVFIDPATPAIGIRIPDDGTRPESRLEHLVARKVFRDDAQWIEVLITQQELFLDGYPLLCAIIDRLQLQNMCTDAAVTETLRVLGRILQRIDVLTVEMEIGLLGELLVLRTLIDPLGAGTAVDAWCGPHAEEHDFALDGLDLEVKSTQSERRAHWISSWTQLDESPGCPLWLLSLQLTRSGPTAGRTLPGYIEHVRAAVGPGVALDMLDQKLNRTGWRSAMAPIMHTRWLLRSTPTVHRVSVGFPRLTRAAADTDAVGVGRITDLRYRIDLTDMPSADGVPAHLEAALGLEI